jgi:RNA polymerase sigma-70 factor (ECF subfamily)
MYPVVTTRSATDVDFTSMYVATAPFVTRYVVRRVRGDVEDIVEDVYVTAWNKRSDMPADADDRLVWLYAIARRTIANSVRLRRRRERFNKSLEPLATPESGSSEAALAVTIVHAALAKMDDKERDILLMVEWDGLTVAQAARVADISDSAAGKRLASARENFRRLCDSRLTS